MRCSTCTIAGIVLAGAAVMLGAFGAHALKATLEESAQLDNWHTAVRYQMWHALALIAYGTWRRGREARWTPAWCFLIGSLLFSGSIYALCFDVARPVMGPITPLGGSFMIAGWVAFGVQAWRSESS